MDDIKKRRKFDTKVQYLQYKVLREVARGAWNGDLLDKITDIPKTIIPGNVPTMRCCVYKERAIISERIRLAMGGDRSNPNVIEVIDIACDDCPAGGYEVTNACRGCLAHRCEDSRRRPCENACKIKAISMNENKAASIDNDKCIACGACVYQCPFGAIIDKSYILDVIDMIKKSEDNTKYKMYAVVAPSVSSQFTYAKLGQVVTGIRKLGFFNVVEAALGADMVAYKEAHELKEKGFLTSSCCPAFVDYIKKQFPDIAPHISANLSPAATIAKYIKSTSSPCRVVFIGPCTAKKMEFQKPEVRPYIDSVITFEELQALFDSRDVDIETLSESALDNASYFGRIFARSGGITDAVAQALKEQGETDFEYKPVTCDGIEACRTALLKKSKGVLDANFIEGMACIDGCIGGAGCLTHGEKNKREVDAYGRLAMEKSITDAISVLGLAADEPASAEDEQ